MSKNDLVVVREFDPDVFHKRVLELEAEGYVADRKTYQVSPEMNPEDGNIVHLHSIEMIKRTN